MKKMTQYTILFRFSVFFFLVSLSFKVKHPLIFPFVSNNPSFKSSRKKKMKSALVVFLSSVYVVSASESTPGCLLRDGDVHLGEARDDVVVAQDGERVRRRHGARLSSLAGAFSQILNPGFLPSA